MYICLNYTTLTLMQRAEGWYLSPKWNDLTFCYWYPQFQTLDFLQCDGVLNSIRRQLKCLTCCAAPDRSDEMQTRNSFEGLKDHLILRAKIASSDFLSESHESESALMNFVLPPLFSDSKQSRHPNPQLENLNSQFDGGRWLLNGWMSKSWGYIPAFLARCLPHCQHWKT